MIRIASLIMMLPVTALAEKSFENRVIDAILNNPEVVLLAIEKLKAVQSEERKNIDIKAIYRFEADLFPSDDIQLVEFSDYRCGYCAQSAQTLKGLAPELQNSVRVIELPILGKTSREIAEVALAIRNEAGVAAYKKFHFAVLESAGRVANQHTALNLAERQGHAAAALVAQLGGDDIQQELDANLALARALGINGTPAFVARDSIHEGILPRSELIDILNNKDKTQ